MRLTKYYRFNSQTVAMRKNGVLTYLHSDHLGSTVLETNTGNAIAADQKYYAYGRQRDSAPVTTDYRFTGQKEDASGLYYFNARYYDPSIGQFVSPDTLVPDPSNVQAYNRYMYALGNPLRYNDPSGHDACGPGANAHCDEYQSMLTTFGNIMTYAQFIGSRHQYQAYLTNPTRYFQDWRLFYGVDAGDRNAAKQRIMLADVYDQYYAPGRIANQIPIADLMDEAERVRTSGNELAFLYGTMLLGMTGMLEGHDHNDHISLFRAVGPDELADIQRTGVFRNPNGIEVKYFSLTEEGARRYGRMAEKAFGDPPYSYVRTSIPRSSLEADMLTTVDQGIPTVVIPTHKLRRLASPTILAE